MYSGFCAKEWTSACSSSEYVAGIPYGNQTEENSLVFEDGYRGVRGYMTEGHYLVFESNGHVLSNPGGNGRQFQVDPAVEPYDSINHRWVVHALTPEGTTFYVTSALDGKYLSQHSSLSTSKSGAEVYNITYVGNGEYVLQKENGSHLNIKPDGSLSFDAEPVPYKVYSVTYHS